MRFAIVIPTLIAAALPGGASYANAADAPAPRVIGALFCVSPTARPCVTAGGQPVRVWWGHAFQTDAEERYVGFVTLLPRRGEAPNPYATLSLMAVEFIRRGGSWQPAGPAAQIGRLRLAEAGRPPSPEPRAGIALRDLPDGGLILAVPTAAAAVDGRQAHAFDILRRGPGGWIYGGFVPGATDESKACQAQARRESDDPRDCEAVSGNLLFEAPGPEGWPGIVVSLDLVGQRNGQPFTTTGWEQHRYAFDAATGHYVELAP